jgi:DNA-binding transcriptional regulator LsrR (DeoR family)
VDLDLDARTLGLELSELAGATWSIAVATGRAKHRVILGGLRSKTFNVLITDEYAAVSTLESR